MTTAQDMLHAPSDVVRYLLIDLGLGTLPTNNDAWPIYDSKEPDLPDNAVTIYTTTGFLQGRIQVTGETVEQFGIQVRIRSNDVVEGYRKGNAILVACDRTVLENTVNIDSTIYTVLSINRKGSLLSLGSETPQSQRSIFTLNALVSIKRIS